MVHYSQCPACKSDAIKPDFFAVDNTVSKEQFLIAKCIDCDMKFTQDAPIQDKIGKYYQSEDYISHTDTKTGLVNSLYHVIRKFTLRIKQNFVDRQTGMKKGNILDIGCGTGAFLHQMKKAGWKVMGLEPDDNAASKAAELYQIEAKNPDLLFQLEPNSFDAISMWHVLEHVHQLDEYIIQLKKLLKEKGVIFIAVPNHTSNDAQYYKVNWAAYDVPRHLYHFSPKSMERLMHRHGLKIKQATPMWFDSFYVSMLSEKYKTGKNNLIAAVLRGFISNIVAFFNHSKCSSVIYTITH